MDPNNTTDDKLINSIYGKGYQVGLPDLPDDPTDGRYYWRRATPEDKISFADKANNRWVVAFEWIWTKK